MTNASSSSDAILSHSQHSYSKVAIFFHWLIAILIIGQLAGGLIMVRVLSKGSSLKFELYQYHKSFGILILSLSVLRLIWRLTHRPPALPLTMPGWEKTLASMTHFIFYFFMLAIPLIGWAMVSVSPLGISTYLFEIVRLPHLPFWEGASDPAALEKQFKFIHEYLAFATIALLVLHIAAALKHHFHDRDDVLTRMLPFLRTR